MAEMLFYLLGPWTMTTIARELFKVAREPFERTRLEIGECRRDLPRLCPLAATIIAQPFVRSASCAHT
jgi:hypothetical protein